MTAVCQLAIDRRVLHAYQSPLDARLCAAVNQEVMNMAVSKVTLPDRAIPVIELIEKLGFKWEFEDRYQVPTDLSRRVQIREEANYTPSDRVSTYARAMKDGSKFPPVVVTRDNFTVDGNTRFAALRKLGWRDVQAVVLSESYENAPQRKKDALHLLGAAFNVQNGKGIDRDEIRRAIETVCSDPNVSIVHAASLLGVTSQVVTNTMSEKKGRDCIHRLTGKEPNGAFKVAALRTIAGASNRMTDPVLTAIISLTQDAGLLSGEIKSLVEDVTKERSEADQLKVVDRWRLAREDQISAYKQGGKVRPPYSAQLRQRLGFVLARTSDDLVERNPELQAEHIERLVRAISVLNDAMVMTTELHEPSVKTIGQS